MRRKKKGFTRSERRRLTGNGIRDAHQWRMKRRSHAPNSSISDQGRQRKRKSIPHKYRPRSLSQRYRSRHSSGDGSNLARLLLKRRQRGNRSLGGCICGRSNGRSRWDGGCGGTRCRRHAFAVKNDNGAADDFVREVNVVLANFGRDGEEEFGDVVGVER